MCQRRSFAEHPNVGAIPGDSGMFAPGAGGAWNFMGFMETLAVVLSNMAGRPVVDKNGMTGTYDIKMEMVRRDRPRKMARRRRYPRSLRWGRSSLG